MLRMSDLELYFPRELCMCTVIGVWSLFLPVFNGIAHC